MPTVVHLEVDPKVQTVVDFATSRGGRLRQDELKVATVVHLQAARPKSDDSYRLGSDPEGATPVLPTVLHLAGPETESAESCTLGGIGDRK